MWIRLFLLTLSIDVAGGCTSAPPTRVHSYWGLTTQRPPRDATFAWSLESNAPGTLSGDEALMAMIRERTESGLINLGYRKREGRASAEFYVSCRLTTRVQPSDAGPIDSGSLVIDAVSGADGRLIWRGWAEGPTDPSLPPEVRQQRIENAVTEILDRFRPS